MSSLRQVPISCAGHTRPVVDLNFSGITAYGYFLISACKDGQPMLRQGETGDWVGTFEGHKGAVWGAAINSDASRAATGAADFSAKIWDAEKGIELLTLPHKHIVKSVHFSSDSSHLLTGSNEMLLRIYDLNKPDEDPLVFSGHEGTIKAAKFTNDDQMVVSASSDKTIRVWNAKDGDLVKTLQFEKEPMAIEIAKEASRLVVAHDMSVLFYDTDTWELVKEFQTPTPVFAASYLPERNIFVCGGDDFKMYKYDYSSGEELEAVKGHFGPVHCVQFSPDGEIYASGSEDGTLRLWQTTVGKTYGLWKYESGPAGDSEGVNTSPPAENGLDRSNLTEVQGQA
ncbi:serine-threonine kinase receptor-associated protein-like [Watersipora subatra]|uniref:serine-threonine kinase receptor-associated protein-like n=1 Tax=Watersipora subatra TaxID=2589382 RepID=UPI00355AED21